MDKKKILIVDFDANAVNSLARFLEEEGYEVIIAPDGEAGLEKCKAESPDMVIMEPMLPKLHGFELCTIISHDLEPKIPVVILTKFYREEQFKIESLRSFGATAFLSKPYNRNSILALLEEHLGGKSEAAPEQDSQIEKEIPSSISLDSLKSLEEQFKKEELELIQDENIEKQLLDAVSSLKIDLPIVEKKPEITLEIDQMLKDTLSEFGLEHDDEASTQSKEPPVPTLEEALAPTFEKKQDPVLEEPQPPEEKPESVLEKEIVFESEEEPPPLLEEEVKVEDEPVIAPESQTEESIEAAPGVMEKEIEEEKEKPVATGSIFGGYTSKGDGALSEKRSGSFLDKLKKPTPQIIIPFAAVILIIVTTVFYLLKPKQADSFPKNAATLVQKNLPAASNDLRSQTESTPAQEGVKETQENKIDDSEDISDSEQTPEKTSPETSPPPASKVSNPPAKPTSTPPSASSVSRPTPALNQAANAQQSIATGNLPEYLEPTVPPKATPDSKEVPKTDNPTEKAKPPPTEKPSEKTEPPKPVESTAAENQPDENKASAPQPQAFTTTPKKTKMGDLVSIKTVDTPPQVIKQELPKYPPLARNKGITGTVIVNALISETGEVIQTVVIRGIKGPFGFNEASEKAVRKWKFKAAEKDGVKVKVWKQIPFSFKEK